jgi:transketolase
MRGGKDATVFAIGSMVGVALEAAEVLENEGLSVRVISMVSIKPMDEDAVVRAAIETGALVAAEDHNCFGGLGGAIAETLSRLTPAPLEQVAIRDVFAESGKAADLRRKYHLAVEDVLEALRRSLARRRAAETKAGMSMR